MPCAYCGSSMGKVFTTCVHVSGPGLNRASFVHPLSCGSLLAVGLAVRVGRNCAANALRVRYLARCLWPWRLPWRCVAGRAQPACFPGSLVCTHHVLLQASQWDRTVDGKVVKPTCRCACLCLCSIRLTWVTTSRPRVDRAVATSGVRLTRRKCAPQKGSTNDCMLRAQVYASPMPCPSGCGAGRTACPLVTVHRPGSS